MALLLEGVNSLLKINAQTFPIKFCIYIYIYIYICRSRMAFKEMKFYIAEIQGNASGIFYTWCRLILVNQNQQRQKKSSNNLNHICVKS